MSDKRLQQLQKKIDEIREITERNNEILQDIKKSMFWRNVFSIVYWVLIIGVAIGAFYFIQPYVDRLYEAYEQIRQGLDTIPTSGA